MKLTWEIFCRRCGQWTPGVYPHDCAQHAAACCALAQVTQGRIHRVECATQQHRPVRIQEAVPYA